MAATEFENAQRFENKVLKGEIVDTRSGPNPVMSPYRDAPNVIVKNEDNSDWEVGDIITVEVRKAKDTYMFGVTFDEEEEVDTNPDKGDFRVLIHIVGNTFESKTFNSKKQAESVKNFIESRYEQLEVELERDR